MKKPKSKILLACPINRVKDYIICEWLEYVEKMEGDFDIFLVDNSKNPDWHLIFKNSDINIEYVSPKGKDTRTYILESRQVIRDYFIKNDYTHLFSLECDVFPPLDAIPRLLKHNIPAVSGYYFIGHFPDTYPLFVDVIELKKAKVTWFYIMGFMESFLKIDGKLVKTHGNGIGCTMLRREVLEKLDFRVNYNDLGFDDSFFFQDLYKNYIDHYCDTSLLCQHINYDWTLIKENIQIKTY